MLHQITIKLLLLIWCKKKKSIDFKKKKKTQVTLRVKWKAR